MLANDPGLMSKSESYVTDGVSCSHKSCHWCQESGTYEPVSRFDRGTMNRLERSPLVYSAKQKPAVLLQSLSVAVGKEFDKLHGRSN